MATKYTPGNLLAAKSRFETDVVRLGSKDRHILTRLCVSNRCLFKMTCELGSILSAIRGRLAVSVLSSVNSAFLCDNLCFLCGFGFCLHLTAEEQTEDFAEDAEKIQI
jgi:hypothetical protein